MQRWDDCCDETGSKATSGIQFRITSSLQPPIFYIFDQSIITHFQQLSLLSHLGASPHHSISRPTLPSMLSSTHTSINHFINPSFNQSLHQTTPFIDPFINHHSINLSNNPPFHQSFRQTILPCQSFHQFTPSSDHWWPCSPQAPSLEESGVRQWLHSLLHHNCSPGILPSDLSPGGGHCELQFAVVLLMKLPARVLSRNKVSLLLGVGKGNGKREMHPRQWVWGIPPKKIVALYPSTSIHQCLLAGKSFMYAFVLLPWKFIHSSF